MTNQVATCSAPSDTMQAFIIAVRKKMKMDRIKQRDLANRLGLTESAVSQKLGGGGGNCTFATADEISRALGTTTIDLLKLNAD